MCCCWVVMYRLSFLTELAADLGLDPSTPRALWVKADMKYITARRPMSQNTYFIALILDR